MARGTYYGDFASLEFPKKGREIVTKAKALSARLGKKIKEREKRIRDAAKEAGMKDAGDVLLSLQSIAEGSSNAGDVNMNVGLAAKLKGELAEMNKERTEVDRLRLIIENLPPKGTFSLKFDELRYFEF
jgi:hypothetical protein